MIDPEYIHIGVTVVIALIGGFIAWQNSTIKLAVSQLETKIEARIGETKLWAHDTFTPKNS